jgi:prepilin-type N-terminal cleavage/methylation domain-containing protein
MNFYRETSRAGFRRGQAGFTLIEVAFAVAIAALVLAGLFLGYNMAGRRAQYSACSLAANAAAMQQMEQIIAADWVPSYGLTNLFSTSLTAPQSGSLCLPSAQGNVVAYTNYATVSQISTNPPYAMIQVQCVWTFPSYGGVYTNTVATLRAPNL